MTAFLTRVLWVCAVGAVVAVGVCRGEGTCRPRVPVLDNGADVPPGDYLKSCSGCFLHEGGTVLRCRSCFASMGRDVPAEAPVARCTSFMNDDGRLVCSFVAQDNAPDVPRGPYLRTCGGCAVVAPDTPGAPRLLSCTECLDRAGARHWAELDYAGTAPDAVCPPGQSVANVDGRLLCAPEEPQQEQEQEQEHEEHSEL